MIQRKLNVGQSLSETNFSVKYLDHDTAQIRKSRLQFLLIFYYWKLEKYLMMKVQYFTYFLDPFEGAMWF